MKFGFTALILAVFVGCVRAEQPGPDAGHPALPSVTNDASAATSVTNRDGLLGLIAALSDVDRVELVRWDRSVPAETLSPADKTRLLQLIRSGRLTDVHTVAHPPWPAAFLFHTRSHGSYATTLVGRANLRLDAGRADGHFEESAARWNGSPPPEMAVDQEDDWLWTYFEAHLGPTREKEYLAPPKAPPYLELPRKP
jgi:hypothetical protein